MSGQLLNSRRGFALSDSSSDHFAACVYIVCVDIGTTDNEFRQKYLYRR